MTAIPWRLLGLGAGTFGMLLLAFGISMLAESNSSGGTTYDTGLLGGGAVMLILGLTGIVVALVVFARHISLQLAFIKLLYSGGGELASKHPIADEAMTVHPTVGTTATERPTSSSPHTPQPARATPLEEERQREMAHQQLQQDGAIAQTFEDLYLPWIPGGGLSFFMSVTLLPLLVTLMVAQLAVVVALDSVANGADGATYATIEFAVTPSRHHETMQKFDAVGRIAMGASSGMHCLGAVCYATVVMLWHLRVTTIAMRGRWLRLAVVSNVCSFLSVPLGVSYAASHLCIMSSLLQRDGHPSAVIVLATLLFEIGFLGILVPSVLFALGSSVFVAVVCGCERQQEEAQEEHNNAALPTPGSALRGDPHRDAERATRNRD